MAVGMRLRLEGGTTIILDENSWCAQKGGFLPQYQGKMKAFDSFVIFKKDSQIKKKKSELAVHLTYPPPLQKVNHL